MEGMKENKKRFFRKGGQSHRIQRSFDNHTGSSSCCRAPAPSPSIDSMSLASGTLTPAGQVSLPPLPLPLQQLQQHHHQLQQLQQQQIHSKHAMGNRITSNPCLPSPGSNGSSSTNSHGTSCVGGSNVSVPNASLNGVPSSSGVLSNGAGGGPTTSGTSNGSSGVQHKANRGIHGGVAGHSPNSASLDEAEINMNCHRRFMPAPRRARSAERFDGMRVAYTSSPGGSGENTLRQATDDVLSRSYRSPQILRTVENNILSSNVGVSGVGVPGNNGCIPNVRRGTTSSSSSASGTKGTIEGPGFPVPSPPPSYTTAVSEARDPPPYHQVVAAMKQPNTLRTQALKGQQQQHSLNNRYAGVNPHHLHHSHSLTSTPTGPTGIRSVASTPIFANVDPVCGCHKCVMAERMNDPSGNGTEYNDAVYMESQAFLMHEIMTDGMAFCSIM